MNVLNVLRERSQFAPDLCLGCNKNRSKKCVQDLLIVVVEPVCFGRHRLYNRASLKIASMWRGVKGRREMRRIRQGIGNATKRM